MTLRTGLLIFLGLLASATLALYFALSQTGGIGVPGGKNALQQALAPYVEESSLNFSEPRIAFIEGEDIVQMTLRSLGLRTKVGGADVSLDQIRAEIDGQRLKQGAIRFRTAEINRAHVTIDVSDFEASQDKPFPTPKEIVEVIEETYQRAFSGVGLERLSSFSIDMLSIALVQNGAPIANGNGSFALHPSGDTMQVSSRIAWTGQGDYAVQGESSLFVMGGANSPLDIALKLRADTLGARLEQGSAIAKMAQVDITYDHRSNTETVLIADVRLEALTLPSGLFFDGQRDFDALSMTARYDARSDVVSAAVDEIPLGASTAKVLVELVDASAEARMTVQAQIAALTADDLKRYWPLGLSDSGRKWVAQNIPVGAIRNVQATFAGALSDMTHDTLPADALSLDFDLEGVTAHYVRPMPPLVGASGSAKMTLEDIFFTIDSGVINDVDAAGSTVRITSFSQSPQRGEIALRLTGSATGLAQALDSQPLGYFSGYEVDPNTLSGEFYGRALLALPLLKDVPLDDVVLSARIDAPALSLTGIVKDEALMFERTVVELNQDALTLRGDVSLTDMTAALRWNEDFTGRSPTPTQISLNGQISPPGIPRWLPFAGDVIFGTVFFDATLQGRGADVASATVTADLTAATVDLPVLGYEKPVAEAAEAYVSFASSQEGLSFEAITLNGPDLLVIGQGELALDGSTAAFTASTIDLPSLKASLNLSKEGDAWLLAGDVRSVDLAPLLDMFWAGALTQSTASSETEDGLTDDIVSVSLSLAEVQLLDGQSANTARVLGSFQGDRVRQLNVFGQGPADAPFTLTVEPIKDGRRFFLASQSAGELANGLGIVSTATGGQLAVQASSFERSGALVLAGLMEMTNVRLIDTPILARLLGLGSLTGVADLARDRGLNFESIDVPFELSNGVVSVANASAKGPALGLTANGQFLDSLEQGDIRGVIVPSYTINSALGRVPVIGDVLVGGKDTGLFGINYRVSGAMIEPDISVNPASMLTPGFLRGIFGDQKGRIDDVSSAPLTPDVIEQTQ